MWSKLIFATAAGIAIGSNVCGCGTQRPTLSGSAQSATTNPTNSGTAGLPDPLYKAWSTFSPGSFAVLEADMPLNGHPASIKLAYKLIRNDRKVVTVRVRESLESDTLDHDVNGRTEDMDLFPTSDATDVLPQVGSKSLQVNGKNFECRIYKGYDIVFPCGTGLWQYYLADGIPGGIVAIDGNDPSGKPIKFRLTSFGTGDRQSASSPTKP